MSRPGMDPDRRTAETSPARPPGRRRAGNAAVWRSRISQVRMLGSWARRHARAWVVDSESAADLWPAVFGSSLAIGVVLVGLAHGVLWFVLTRGGPILSGLGVGFALTVATLGIAVLAWLYWRMHVDHEDPTPYFVAMCTSPAILGVGVVAFAGLTTWLLAKGAVSVDHGLGARPPGLPDVESYYAWHLVDTVPLVGAPEALHWPVPLVFTDPLSGALLLAFKITLLIPIVRLLFAWFDFGSRAWLAGAPKRATRRARWAARFHVARPSALTHSAGGRAERPMLQLGRHAVLLVSGTLLAYALLELAVGRASWIGEWLEPRLPDPAAPPTLLGRSLPAGLWRWAIVHLDEALAVAAALMVVSVAWSLAESIMTDYEGFLHADDTRKAGAVLFPCWLFVLAVSAATAVTLVLLRLGIARTVPTLAPAREVNATLEWYAWHLMDSVPVLDIPQTLGWRTDVEYVDGWSGLMLLLLRFVLIGLLIVPVVLAIRVSADKALRRRPRAPQLGVIAEFIRTVDESANHLARAERAASRGADGPTGSFSIDRHSLYLGNEAAAELEKQIVRLSALLGQEHPIVEAASATTDAVRAKAAAIEDEDARWPLRDRLSGRERPPGLDQRSVDLATCRAQFVTLVATLRLLPDNLAARTLDDDTA